MDARSQKHFKNLDQKQMLSLIDMQHNSRNLNDKVAEATATAKGHGFDDTKIELGGKKIDISGTKRNESDFDFLKHHMGGGED